MPIAQERMISVIAAARDYQHALREASRYVKEAQKAVDRGGDPALELRRMVALIDELSLLSSPIESSTTILLEEKHFKDNSRRNSRHAERNRVKRRDKNVKPHDTAPKSLTAALPAFSPNRAQRREEGIKAVGDISQLESIQFSGLDENTKRQIEQFSEMDQRAQEFEEEEKKRKARQAERDNAPPGLYDKDDDTAPILTSKAIAKEGE